MSATVTKRSTASLRTVLACLLYLGCSELPAQNDATRVNHGLITETTGQQVEFAKTILQRPFEYPFGSGQLLAESRLATETRGELQAIANALRDSYQARVRVQSTPPDSWFILFADEKQYRRFRRQFGQGLPRQAEGHASGKLAATFVSGHSPDHLRSLVIHETVHLLNRATFEDRLPSWLDEGLATSLSYNRVDANGHLILGTISSTSSTSVSHKNGPGGRRTTTHRIELEGPMAALLKYSEQPQSWPPLGSLLGDWSDKHGDLELLYPQAGLLVRYLFDGVDGDTQREFRALLRELATRNRPELVRAFEGQFRRIEPGFGRWLDQLANQSLAQLKTFDHSP